jgi:hypothetical protein
MLGTNLRGSRGDQTGQGRDQLAGLVQVLQLLGIVFCSKAKLDRGGTHQVDGCSGDDLDGRHLGDVADLLRDVAGGTCLIRRRLENV